MGAADYLSRIYVNPSKKFQMKIKNEVPAQNIELKIYQQSLDTVPSKISQTNVISTTTMTINSVEEGILANMLLEDNTLYSMAEKNSIDELNLDFKLESLEIPAEQTTDIDNA